ncbi:M13-type metalloendopeptidase [Sphingopyxis sp. DBS4]|uniref:M13-type metalloendopeptidase n=1 Tax=Sphingopyxis sp. DBS4 TaxID=2968500 RepID=UPI00214AFA77|nr:M13-type metalloendopeptidase [Sphingopyxis sp. DBS4]
MTKFFAGAAGLALAAALAAAPALAHDDAKVKTLLAEANDDASASGDGSLKALTFGTWGVDLGARDTSVKPGDDFDKYANGGWFARTEIPADQASAGVDYDVYNLTQRQLRQLVTGAPATSQVGGLYQSFMDETRVDLYGNVKRSAAFEYAYALSDLDKPVDRKKWSMNPQEVNAYNGGLENKIVFPAAILQAPYFAESVDDAVNYGAIGAVIGHEITHGFDDQGRKIDANGAVRDWWTAADAKRFDEQAKGFGAQYATYEAAPGAFINPDLTMGENLADLAGLEVAYDAYHRSLDGKEAPVIDGLSGDQRFFLAFAQAWRDKARDDAIKQQVASDPHSPSRWRIIGPLRNVDAWYKAFNVPANAKYYLKPEDRTRIW